MLNTNEQERRKNASKDLAIKLSFELALYKVLRPLFMGYSKEFVKKYSALALFPNIESFNATMRKTLVEHYKAVARKFSRRAVDELGVPENHSAVLDRIGNITDTHHSVRAAQSADIISDTTQKDLLGAIQKTKTDALQTGEILSKEDLARRASLEFDKKSLGRLNIISATETQNPAEHAKQTEVESLAHHDAIVQGVNLKTATKQKQWLAVLDNVTREAHAEADGQMVEFDMPYIVNGQSLMFPGDMSLGATIDNTINCRCSSIIIVR